MNGNPNAVAAALTAVFVYLISRLVAHYGLVDVTPGRILLAAGCLTSAVLWIGRTGIRGALARLWDGAGRAVNGSRPDPPQES